MIRALYTAATGMNAQQANIDNVAHNLANVNTTGFKKSRMEFEDLVYQEIRAAGASASSTTEPTVAPTTTTAAVFDPAAVGEVTVDGPITGGEGQAVLAQGAPDLASKGYVEEEDLIEQAREIITVGEFYEMAAGGEIIFT